MNAAPLIPPSNGAVNPPSNTGGALGSSSSKPEINRIVLNDGTCIVIKSEDEYLFIGPQNQQMMVNCLPLFQMRLENGQNDSAGAAVVATSTVTLAQNTGSPVSQCEINKRRRGTKAERRFVLKKSASTENILTPSTPPPEKSKHSSEAEDVLDQQGKESVHVQRETWAHFTKSADYSTHVSNPVSVVVPPQVITETASPVEETSEIEKLSGEGKNREGEKKEGAEMVDGSMEGVSGEGEGASKEEGEGEQTRGSEGKSAQVLSDGGSDGEEAREMRVSYIENPGQMQTLKRSSGSVSFFGNVATMIPVAVTHSPPSPSVVEEDRGEDVDGGQVSVAACGMGMGEGVSGNGELVDEKSEAVASGEEKEKDVAEGEREEVGTKAEREQTDTENGVGAATSADESTAKQKEEGGGSSEKASLTQAPSQQPQPQPQPNAPSQPSQPPATTSPQTSQQNVPQPTGQSLPSHPVITPLPPPPMTFEPEFIERSGWLTKLSHRKGGWSGQSMQEVLLAFVMSFRSMEFMARACPGTQHSLLQYTINFSDNTLLCLAYTQQWFDQSLASLIPRPICGRRKNVFPPPTNRPGYEANHWQDQITEGETLGSRG